MLSATPEAILPLLGTDEQKLPSVPSSNDPSARVVTLVRRDRWNGDEVCRTHCIHLPDNTELHPRVFLIDLFGAVDAQDGEEVEITIRKTGKMPFGCKRIVLRANGTFSEEAPREVLARLLSNLDESPAASAPGQ